MKFIYGLAEVSVGSSLKFGVLPADAARTRPRKSDLVEVRTRADRDTAGLSDQAEIGTVILGARRAQFSGTGCAVSTEGCAVRLQVFGEPGWASASAATVAGIAHNRNQAEGSETELDTRRHHEPAVAGPGPGCRGC